MKLYAIMGARSHGKSTAAQALEMRGYRHINFADPIREVVELVYDIPMAVLQDANLKEKVWMKYPYLTPRKIMQYLGTEAFRTLEPDTWIEAFKRRCEGWSHVVCSDLRFPNEAETVRAIGGEIIKIFNPRIDHGDAASQHLSETLSASIVPHHVIINDGDINALHAKIGALIDA